MVLLDTLPIDRLASQVKSMPDIHKQLAKEEVRAFGRTCGLKRVKRTGARTLLGGAAGLAPSLPAAS